MPKKKSERACRSTFTYEGKRYEATGKTQKEADQKAALKLDKLKRGEVGISGNMAVGRWADAWLEIYKRPKVGEPQYKLYKSYVDNIIKPAIGSLPLRGVTSVHLQKILNSREGYSKSDIDKFKGTLKGIFSRAHKATPPLIAHNPAADLEAPAAEDGTHRSITDFERKHILALAETHSAGLWVKVMLYAGLRPGETRALNWQHIDFDQQLICVRKAMKAGTKKIGPPKTKAGERDIPIHIHLLPALKEAHKAAIAKAKAGDSGLARMVVFDPVFTQPTTGRRHTKTSMACLWDNFKGQLDIAMGAKFEKRKAKDGKMRMTKVLSVVAEDLVPYCLRHTCCTDWEEAGVPINVARYLMGHKDIRTTSKIYTHTTKQTIRNVADIINSYAAGVKKESQMEQ